MNISTNKKNESTTPDDEWRKLVPVLETLNDRLTYQDRRQFFRFFIRANR